MKLKTIIYGAGCQGRAILDILENDKNVEIVGFIDDNEENHEKDYFGKKIIGGIDDLKKLVDDNKVDAGIMGIGGYSKARKEKFDILKKIGLKIVNAIHDSAIISKNVKSIGEGVFIGAGAVIGPDVIIGNNVIVNNYACLTIGNIIEDHVNITPGVNFAAGTVLKEESYIGMGANIKQYIKIGKRVIIGSGAVVLGDIPDNVVAVGIPAKVLKRRSD